MTTSPTGDPVPCHYCGMTHWPLCQPPPQYYVQPMYGGIPKGCICPPKSEKTCEAEDCPRKKQYTLR